ncbi:hypothetical protein C2G38_2179540 [Gigaspora rosea]|uniref:Uncharacterized protein n=1 Tax=Gigaspora rosea TaxID=44941 RepID=A0A397VMG4_9GLOM|nr:hypothetical protein C2G38_2179540 [Gigaspora rosea]
MFQGLSIKSKKTSKNTQSKKANKGMTVSLESTKGTTASLELTRNTSLTYERTLARIIENQGEILSKLKVIKDKVGRIENRLNDLEQKMDNSFDITNDKAFKELLQKIRSLQGTLTNKIKETLFSVYGNLIEPINNKAKPDEVIMWKKSTKTNECYQKLFEELEEDSDDTYMNRILYKIWPDGKAPPEKIAYAIAVCQTMLNPKNKIITMSDHVVKKLIAINLEQGSKRKNNSNYSDKQNISKGCDFTNLILKITELVDLDPEEVQEAPDEDVDKEKDTDNYEKNTDNDE